MKVRRTDGITETWTPGDTGHRFHATARIEDRLVTLQEGHGPGGRQTRYRSVRISNRQDQASAVLVAEEVGGAWRVCLPQDKLARVFRRFPIRTSYSLPINLILDAPLDVDPERQHVSLATRNKQLLNSCLTSIASAVDFASVEGWRSWHLLAEVGSVPAVFTDEPGERSWWQEELGKVAGRLASMPLVETPLRRLPAKTSGNTPAADFPVPRLVGAFGEDETALDRVWPLVELAPILFT